MIRLHRYATLLVLTLLLTACGGGGGPEPTATPTEVPTSTPTSTVAIPDTPPAAEIELPEGFTAYVVAEGLAVPTSIARSPDGALYVSQLGDPVFRLEDGDGDGVFEEMVTYVSGFSDINGIAFPPQGDLYVSSRGRVSVVRDADGDTVSDAIEEIISGLPNGRHQNNGLAFGPDGKLYITNGSTCNECNEADESSATILQANPDGSDLRVYGRGLRNSYDLVFDPQGRLWVTDNGSDPPCNTIDELNLIEQGSDYGWPYQPACDSFQSGIPPVGDLGLNTASTGIDYYDGAQFPAQYRGNLFIALWGNLPFAPAPAGHILVRAIIDETPDGPRATVEEFGTGFENPIDVLVDGDGTLLVLDFGSGKLYRIVFTGG